VSTTLARLRAAVRESGSPLAASLGEDPQDPVGPEDPAPRVAAGPDPAGAATELALLAAGGSRVAATRDDVEIAVAAVEEGYRLHYARGRALTIDDPDFALLAGDRMYALGLALLAEIGDLTAIAELADVISLGAQAQANADTPLADAAWQAGAAAIATGSSPVTEAAKTIARAGDPDAAQALHKAAQVRFDTDLG
jgi:hypothetical protein